VASRTGFHAGFLFGIFYDPKDRGDIFIGNNRQQDAISQKIETLYNHRCANLKSYESRIYRPIARILPIQDNSNTEKHVPELDSKLRFQSSGG
jgi:hypothetical protein